MDKKNKQGFMPGQEVSFADMQNAMKQSAIDDAADSKAGAKPKAGAK